MYMYVQAGSWVLFVSEICRGILCSKTTGIMGQSWPLGRSRLPRQDNSLVFEHADDKEEIPDFAHVTNMPVVYIVERTTVRQERGFIK